LLSKYIWRTSLGKTFQHQPSVNTKDSTWKKNPCFLGDSFTFFDTSHKERHMKATEQDFLVSVYRETFPAAAQLIKRLGGTVEEAKDVFHDALLIYLERKATGELQIQTSVKAYLLGITKILWLHSRQQYFFPLPEEVENFVQEEQRWSEKEKNIRDYLVLAGEKCLQLLKAFYFEGLSLTEIAGQFGFGGVRSATVQKYKCLEKIRAEVKKINVYEQRAH
jgi:DNA-directed RNA polymerase specialized sigma24 family protein